MLYVWGEGEELGERRGKAGRRLTPLKVKHSGGAVPSEGYNWEFLGISLRQPVSVPGVGMLSPVSLWDVGTGCLGGCPCPGQSPHTYTGASLVQHQFCTSLHSSPSQLQLLKAEGRRKVSALCCSLQIKIKKTCKIGY